MSYSGQKRKLRLSGGGYKPNPKPTQPFSDGVWSQSVFRTSSPDLLLPCHAAFPALSIEVH